MTLPYNPITNAQYSGQNIGFLAAQAAEKGYTSHQFAGFKQWIEAGRVVKKGEKALHALMVVTKKTKDGEKKVCKGISLFNFEQTIPLEQPTAEG